MAKSHRKYYLAITNDRIEPKKSFDEAKAFSHGKPGGLVKGFNSYQEAIDAIPAIRTEIKGRMKRSKPKRNRNTGSPRAKADLSFLSSISEKPKFTKILKCKLGSGGKGSTITACDGATQITEVEKGTVSFMRLQLGYQALLLAKKLCDSDTDFVEIQGLDITVIKTLTEWAPKWKQEGWIKPNGQPRPNTVLVQSMLELYEQMKGNVSLGGGAALEPAIDNDIPF